MIVELVLIVCLSTTPDSCREERPPMFEPMTPMACMLQGQEIAINWLEEHPRWHLAQWRCQPKGRDT